MKNNVKNNIKNNDLKEHRKNLFKAAHEKVIQNKATDWIELLPYGLVVSADQSRPVMIFKDKEQAFVMPVWLSPMDAGLAVSASSLQKTDAHPHKLSWKILSQLGVQLENCFFKRIEGPYQILELTFTGSEHIQKIEARADEALSFCLVGQARFFARPDFIQKAKVMDGELHAAMFSAKKMFPGIKSNNYLN